MIHVFQDTYVFAQESNTAASNGSPVKVLNQVSVFRLDSKMMIL